MSDTNSQSDKLEQIIEAFTERLEAGDRPSIEEYQAKHPELADRIAAVLPALVALESLATDPSEPKLALDDSIPEVLGEYRIIQEVGRGGMGIVFEAEHVSMQRRVALKVLPKSSAAKNNYLNRFQNEARSAGKLHHTNIVPVFDTGEQDGIYFYSMQFIRGDNLDRVIDDLKILRDLPVGKSSIPALSKISQTIAQDLVSRTRNGKQSADPELQDKAMESTIPLDARSRNDSNNIRSAVAQPAETTIHQVASDVHSTGEANYHQRVALIGAQIADALDYAHNHKIFHRDVKPSNLILDTDGNAWITDFGLAKLDTNDLTQTGDIIGTLRYMAPERFAGKADSRSDIYSLGLTLYELATLQCAFGAERGALEEDVAKRSTVIQPRKIDESIPVDLETIILKAVEPEPDRRYQSARQLCDDLQLFLQDRPIKARRVSMFEKAYRTCRRNPIVSTLAICSVMLLMVIALGALEFARKEIQSRKLSQKNLFAAKLDQARMRRFSQRPGQRVEALRALKGAVQLLPDMDFDDDSLLKAKFELRNEAVAAMSLNDIENEWSNSLDDSEKMSAFSSDGSLFAIGKHSGVIAVREAGTGDLIRSLPSPTNEPPWTMVFSPNREYLLARYHVENASIKNMTTVLWDLESGKQLTRLTQTRDVDFSPDSTRIAITYLRRIDVLELPSGELAVSIEPDFVEDGVVRGIKLNSDATQVAIHQAGEGRIEIWNVEPNPKLEHVLEIETPIYSFDWNSDRNLLAAGGSDGQLTLWRDGVSEPPHQILLHQNSIFRTCIHPTFDFVVTSAWDSTTRMTDFVAGKEVLRIENLELMRTGVSQRGQLFLKDKVSGFGRWNVLSPLVKMFSMNREQGWTCRFHPIATNLVIRNGGDFLEIWNVSTHECIQRIELFEIREIMFNRDGDRLFVGGKDGIFRWDVELVSSEDGDVIELSNRFELTDKNSKQFTLSSDGSTLIAAIHSNAHLIDTTSGELIRKIGPHSGMVNVALYRNESVVLTGTWKGYGIKAWDRETGQLKSSFLEDSESVVPVVPEQSAHIYSCVGAVQKFEWQGDQLQPLAVKDLGLSGRVHFSEDGELMTVLESSFDLHLLATKEGDSLAKFVSLGQSRIINVDFSTDQRFIALACFDNLQIIDLAKIRSALDALGLDW